ncbi:nucleotide-diphospho-sugar transferase [Hypoxylon rubiginosum]|uniref:Nucleotide-diphospho-sugar transferase n=1 Tax=Hypoxylon rubiginosum TaxID=110542 RepID=A0ACC0CX49_9PEZI|nr:nucleotide-diphospho-sugar transferase [Hypoxylon rubiginosum]
MPGSLVVASRRFYWILGLSIAINLFLFAQYYRVSYNVPELPPVPQTITPPPRHVAEFPKKIWQSWKDDSEDPTDRSAGLPHEWRALNPDYRYERITDDNINTFVRDNFPANTSERFAGLADPILKADFLRYLILYSQGGVWADVDVKPVKPITDWIPEKYQTSRVNLVVGIENDHHKRPIWRDSPYSVQLAQYCVYAKPNHPAIGNLIAKVEENLDQLLASKAPGESVSFEEVMSNTGPFVFTDILMAYFSKMTGNKYTGNEMDRMTEPLLIDDVLVLPLDSFGWLEHEHRQDGTGPNVLVKHLFMGSWREGHPG